MRWIKKVLFGMVLMLGLTMVSNSVAYADGVGDTGGTGQGDIGGTNVYTFSYIYDSARDASELQIGRAHV